MSVAAAGPASAKSAWGKVAALAVPSLQMDAAFPMDTLTSYRIVTRDLTRSLSTTAKEKAVANDSKYYLANIGKVTTIDQFVGNARLFTFAMTAFGLGDMTNAKGLIKKVLTEGVGTTSTLAYKLNDSRYVALAKAFNFAQTGTATTQAASLQQPVVDSYVRQQLEAQQGTDNPGVQLALYFQRMAPTVKSAYGLLGDTSLWKVIKTAFDFPDAMANAPIDKQAQAITARLKIADLADPAKVDKLLRTFAVKYDIAQGASTSPVLQLFNPSTVSTNVSMSVLSLKYGG